MTELVTILGYEDVLGQRLEAAALEELFSATSWLSWVDFGCKVCSAFRFHNDDPMDAQRRIAAIVFTQAQLDAISAAETRILAESPGPHGRRLAVAPPASGLLLAKCGVLWGARSGGENLRFDGTDSSPGRALLALNDIVSRSLTLGDDFDVTGDDREELLRSVAAAMVVSVRMNDVPMGDLYPLLVRYLRILLDHDIDDGTPVLELYEDATGRPFFSDLLIAVLCRQYVLGVASNEWSGMQLHIDVRSAKDLIANQAYVDGWISDFTISLDDLLATFEAGTSDPEHPMFPVDMGGLLTRPVLEVSDSQWLIVDADRLVDSVVWGLRSRIDPPTVGERIGHALERYIQCLLSSPQGAGLGDDVLEWWTADPENPGAGDRAIEVADAVVLSPEGLVVFQVKGMRAPEENPELFDFTRPETIYRRTFFKACRQFQKHLSRYRDGEYSPPNGGDGWNETPGIWPVIISFDSLPSGIALRPYLRDYAISEWPIFEDEKVKDLEVWDLDDLESAARVVNSGCSLIDLLRTKAADLETSTMSMSSFLVDSARFVEPQDDELYMTGFDRLQTLLADFLHAAVAERWSEIYRQERDDAAPD